MVHQCPLKDLIMLMHKADPNYEEIDGGFIAFGGNSKGGKFTRKGRKSALCFMRPFGCPVTILNTIDHLGKFDEKANEGFFVGYSTNSKAFRVFNSRTRIMEENLIVKFSGKTSNIARSGPNWLFDIDALTKSMIYKPVVAGNQSNNSAGTKACDNVGKTKMETIPEKDYILLPLWTQDLLFSFSLKDSPSAGFKPSGEKEKKDAEDPRSEDSDVLNTKEPRVNQEKDANVNNTNNINTVSPTDNVDGIENNVIEENIVYGCVYDPNMLDLEEIGRFSDAVNDDSGANMNNLDTYFQFSPVLTTRIYKDHPLEYVIGDLHSAPQRRRMSKNLEGHGLVSTVNQRTNHKDLQNFARIEAIRLFLAYASFKDFVVYQMDVKSVYLYGKIEEEKGMIDKTLFIKRDKSDIMLVQVYVDDIIFGSTRKEMCTEFKKMMHKKFQMSFIGEVTFFLRLQVRQKEDGIFISQDKYVNKILTKFGFFYVKTASTPMDAHKTLLKDKKGEDLDKHLYRSMIGSLLYLTSSRPDIMFTDLPFDLEAYTDSDYAGASLDRKSTTGEAGYVAASSCCGQVLWIKNQLLDYWEGCFEWNRKAAQYEIVNPTIYTSCVEQFWEIAKVKNINGEAQLHAKVDVNKVVISEESIRRDLQFEDEGGIDCLPNETIFEQLSLMGKGFSRRDTPLFPTTMKKQKPRKPRRQDTDEIQPSDRTTNVEDEAFNEENVSQHSNDPLQVDQQGKEVIVEEDNAASIATSVTAAATTDVTIDELTLAQALVELKSAKPRADKVVIQEQDLGTTTTTAVTAANTRPKAKSIVMQEPKEEVQKALEANIAMIEQWHNVQAKIDADYELAQRLQAEEKEQLTDAEKARLFMEFLEKRKTFFVAKRNEKKEIDLQPKLNKRVSWKDKAEIAQQESSSKRARGDLDQERSKKQKIEGENEYVELKICLIYSSNYEALVARNAEFLENSLITQEASGSLEDLEIIQEEDTHPSIDTSVNYEVDDLKTDEPQNDIIPICRFTMTANAPDRMCLYIHAEEYELGDLGEPANYKAALLDPESDK
nr:hypothetical protein [Tanacetum cinerariifolium]